MVAASELSINTNANATQMAQQIFGDGVTVVGASYTGDTDSSGIYTGGDATSPGVVPGDTGIILSTGEAQDFTNSAGGWGWWWGGGNQANQQNDTGTNTSGPTNNPDFNAAAGTTTYDASFLDVDFIPTGDTLTIQFVFSSEEYPEYTNSLYQDFVGVWVNGEQVELSIGDAAPNNVNATSNENLYIDNTDSDYNTEMDGFTVTMSLKMTVTPGEVNSLRIGIADVTDSNYDSNLLIAGDSVQTALVANEDLLGLYGNETKTFDVLENDETTSGNSLTITHVNGQAVSTGSVVTLNTGQAVTLNADGTLTLVGDGSDEAFSFTYTIDDGINTDTALVLVDAIPCFVAGTRIKVPGGTRPIETLRPGDMVRTRDDGLQPVRWIAQRTVPATGALAPIRFEAGALGDHEAIAVSPQHRMLVRDPLAELMFWESEVLVKAKDLVNGESIARVEGGEVTYVHIMFDRHQIVYANGLASESFLPGCETEKMFDRDMVDEILEIFPELDFEDVTSVPAPARLPLKGYEGRSLARSTAA